MPLDHLRHATESYIILSDNMLHVIESDFILLDQKRHSIGPAAYWKKFVSQSAFPDTYVDLSKGVKY